MGCKLRQKPPGSGVWYVFATKHGRRRAFKAGTDYEVAEALLRKVDAQLTQG